MWLVEYKPNNDSQEWIVLDSFEDKASALSHASRITADYYMVKVTDPEGSVIWSN